MKIQATRIALLLALFLGGNARAQTDSSATGLSPVMLGVEVRYGEAVDGQNVQRVFATWGTNHFVFTTPPDLRADVGVPGKIIFKSTDRTYYLELQLLASAPGFPVDAQQTFWLMQAQYPRAIPQATNSETFLQHGGSSLSFLLPLPGGNPRSGKISLVESPAGTWKILMLADPAAQGTAEEAFRQFRLSARSDERGKLVVPVILDHS